MKSNQTLKLIVSTNPLLVSVFFLALFPFSVFSQSSFLYYNGDAFDLSTGKKVYSDFHEEKWVNGKHVSSVITFKDANGISIGKKDIDFTRSATVPNFQMDDFRDGYREGARWSGDQINLFFRKLQADPIQEKLIKPPPSAVMDGGFDFYIRKSWDDLMKGEKKVFQFLVPVKLDSFMIRVYKTDEVKQWKGREAISLRMEVNNKVVRQILKPIFLVYDVQLKRILEYRGISNINSEDGKSLKVKITYDYPKEILDEVN